MINEKLIGKSILWNSIGSTVYLGCLWLLNILVVRLGNYEEAGLLSLAISIANVVQSISLAGVRNYQVSDVQGEYSDYVYVKSRMITSAMAMMGCLVFVLLNDYNFNQMKCIIAMSVYRIIDAIVDVYHGVLQKQWRLDIAGISLMLRGFSVVSVFTVVLVFTQSLFLAILSITVSSFCVFIICDLNMTSRIKQIKKSVPSMSTVSLLLKAMPLLAYSTLLNSISVVTRYFIEIYCGTEALGYYSSIASPALIVQVAATYVFNPMIGVFSGLIENKDKKGFNKLMLKCLYIISGFIILAVLCCWFLGDWGLCLLFGADILEYNYLLIPIVVTTAFTAIVLFLSMLLTVVRDMKGLVISNGVAFLINIFLSPVMIKYFGMQGANIILAIVLLVDIISLTVCIRKKISDKIL